MTRFMAWTNSMAGRMFFVLLAGFMFAGAFGMTLAGMSREAQLERLHIERAAMRVARYHDLAGPEFAPENRSTIERVLPGITAIDIIPQILEGDPRLTKALRAVLPDATNISANRTSMALCFPDLMDRPSSDHSVSEWQIRTPTCWLISYVSDTGKMVTVAVQTPMTIINLPSVFEPAFLTVLFLGAVILALILSYLAASPLKHLTYVADHITEDGITPIARESGPNEMRSAARAFNKMRAVVRERIAYRAEMLAGIAHDLQTPLTRMWLRLESMPTSPQQLKLIDDVKMMTEMVGEGLDLVRDAEAQEELIATDLDSLIDAVVDDASDLGDTVTFSARSGVEVMVRPMALRRALTNLVDNALHHGGGAVVSIVAQKIEVELHVLNAGISPDWKQNPEESVTLQPHQSTGLGLRIARKQAALAGAALRLDTRAQGGVDACLIMTRT
ncbi:MAG: ATP-binding protein [Pseudomonadota bacterium]